MTLGALLARGLLAHPASIGGTGVEVVVGLLDGLGARGSVPMNDVGSAVDCGSFVGMASTAPFPSVAFLPLAGLVTGFAYLVTERAFVGYGGKLGTLVFVSRLSVVGADGLPSLAARSVDPRTRC